MFQAAKAQGTLDLQEFNQWRERATQSSWNELERAWQAANCPNAFTWPILQNQVETFAQTYGIEPFIVLGAFLYPPQQRIGAEGDWLDWQDQDVKTSIYEQSQRWAEKATQKLGDQSWMLLNLAVACDALDAWTRVPAQCVEHLDWYKAMYALNTCKPESLRLETLARVPSPLTTGPLPWTECMVQTAEAKWRNVSRCVELQAGPGLWVQYVMGGDPQRVHLRRQTTWNHVKLDGLDAWALEQIHSPAASFEESFRSDRFAEVKTQHGAWAHQWWLECVLGMEPARACELARNVHTPVCPGAPFVVDNATFTGLVSEH